MPVKIPLMNRLVAILLLLAYTVTSLGPRGASLCIGGGHDWGQLIAARCEHGGHSHGPATSDADNPGDCVGCDHHQSNDHGPCTDIPLDPEEGRPTFGQAKAKLTLQNDPDLGSAVVWFVPNPPRAMVLRPPPNVVNPVHSRHQVMASLHAVILLI